MGASFKKLLSYVNNEDPMRLLMVGLDAAGKTTILYKMKLNEVVTTIPTIGFNVETVTSGNVEITCWDVGGRDKIRPLWRHYYKASTAVVFVVDSNDRDRTGEACEQLHEMANEELLKNLPILIFANKQDLPNALTTNELKEKLELSKLDEMKTPWYIQSSVATTGDGLYEGFQWLVEMLKPKQDLTKPLLETANDSKTIKDGLLSLWKSIDLKALTSNFI